MSIAFRRTLLCLSLLLAPLPVSAYDAETGRRKAEEVCVACHGKAGLSVQPTVPSLAGQQNDYVVLALFQFRAGHRPSELMAPMAAPLTNDDLGNLAAYYSELKPWQPERKTGAVADAAGPALTRKNNCIQCHGPGLAGQDSVPRVAGQKIEYLRAQLRAFRAGNRGDIDGNMTSAVAQLSDGDIDILADYVSGLPAP